MGKTILVVDDSPMMRQTVAVTLKSAGFEVLEAGDGKEAVGKLHRGRKPDLVITDLHLPNMDAAALIRAVRAMPACRDIPIFVLTTPSDETKKKNEQDAGASGWIIKPFNPHQMLKTITDVLLR